jgi:NAD-dependent deacetylase
VTDDLARARQWLDEARSVVVLTGAGISTDSGIPDFRGPQGLWTKNPKAERMSDLRYYVRDPEVRRLAWQNRLRSPAWTAEPNAGHRALVELQRRGTLHALLTQNIDELHQQAGIDPAKVVELHGTLRRYTCLACGAGGPMEDVLARVRAGDEDPACEHCSGILKSATISFGQNLDPALLARAEQAAADADLFLAVGTSLTVYPAARLPEIAVESGARLVIINAEPTPLDGRAHAVLRGEAGEILSALLEASSIESWTG